MTMAIPMAKVRRLIEIKQDLEGLLAQKKTKDAAFKKLADELIEAMLKDETQSITSGDRTIYLQSEISTKMVPGKTDDERKAALESLGLSSLIKPYSQSITAQAREWMNDKEEIPAAFSECWEISTFSKLGMRRKS